VTSFALATIASISLRAYSASACVSNENDTTDRGAAGAENIEAEKLSIARNFL
jgi:hypothetical protein